MGKMRTRILEKLKKDKVFRQRIVHLVLLCWSCATLVSQSMIGNAEIFHIPDWRGDASCCGFTMFCVSVSSSEIFI